MAFEIKGLDEFNTKLKEMKEEYPDHLDNAMDDTADAISLMAQIKVPVDTGRLRASINVGREYLRKSIGTNVEYAGYVEFGTSGQKPQPYLRPAYEENKDRITEFLEKILAS